MTSKPTGRRIIIGDPGSCHLGELSRAKTLISVGAEAGLDAVKFQLFRDKAIGNIPMPDAWIPELVEHGKKKGVEVFASVWDQAGIDALAKAGCQSIKFAYSMRDSRYVKSVCLGGRFERVYLSCNLMSDLTPLGADGDNVIHLYCIPEYPVPYQVHFAGLFNATEHREAFDGFSDHTLGIIQSVAALQMGARVIEKHYCMGVQFDNDVPDGRFALSPKELGWLCTVAHDELYRHLDWFTRLKGGR